jgi:hypothetical protein
MESNPGGAAFYCKLAHCMFNQALLHKVRECMWDSATQTVTSPGAQSDIAAIAEFERQDCIQDIDKAGAASTKENAKGCVDPNIAFPFKDDFSIGTIHGANVTKPLAVPPTETTAPDNPPMAGTPGNQNTVIEILDNNADDDISALTTKLQNELVAL